MLLCAAIPLLVIYYSAHAVNVKIVQQEVASSLMRQNQDFSDRLQDDLTRIINTNYMLSQNWELGKLAVVPEEYTPYEKAQIYQNIQDKIFLAQLNSRFIENISVYFPALDKCLSTSAATQCLSSMRELTAQLESLPRDRFFLRDGKMICISEITFFREATVPNLVVQTTLSSRELLNFFLDIYWDDMSGGTIISLSDSSWPQALQPGSLLALFYSELQTRLTESVQNVQHGQLTMLHDGQAYELIYSYIPYADLVLIRYIDLDRIEKSVGLNQSMPVIFAAVVALSFLLIYLTHYRLVSRPLKQLVSAFSRVENGNLDFELDAEAHGEFAFVFNGFSHMLSRLRRLIEETYLQGQMVKKSEFKQLQAQIDPHFLYNGFFILNKRIRAGDNEGALAFSKLLSDYFRYVTQNARDTVPLIEEVSHAYNYARIQQVRFSNRLLLTLDPVPENCEQIPIPRLVLQPIVENVFKHVLDRVEGTTILRISYEETDDGVELCIEDSGSGLTENLLNDMRTALAREVDEKEISGLTNVHMRIKLFYGEQYGLFFDKSSMGGLCVRIRLPNRKEGKV